ncbi:hypothetical protein EZS27_014831 [termite gut metagenome]|uniref:Uncharacterized protein n=1 Tax=termite gut metagenome TaxID=433724 RepID=A0A5J4RSS6_9ZZZZ
MKEDEIYDLITNSAKRRFDYETFEKTFALPDIDYNTAENILWLMLMHLAMGEKPSIVALHIHSQILLTGFMCKDISGIEKIISTNQNNWETEISTLKMATADSSSNCDKIIIKMRKRF